jgi:hypothetical protein
MKESPSRRPYCFEPHAWIAAGVLACMAVAANPTGEFPIFDDFDYSATVRDLLVHREMRLSDWPSMTLIGQAAWGALFCLPHGFSHLALRASTLTMMALAGAAAYDFARRRDVGRLPAAWIAVLIVTGPQTFLLGCTFMTDAPGMAWTLVLLAAVDRIVERSSVRGAALVGVLGSAAYLFRQTAAIPLIAGVLVELARRRWMAALAMSLPVALAHVAFRWWLERVNGVPHHMTLPMIDPAVLLSAAKLAQRGLRTLATCGLYLFPVGAWLLASGVRPWGKAAPWVVLVLSGLLAICAPAFAPYDGWLVFDLGLGADFSLERAAELEGPQLLLGGRLLSLFRIATTVLACIGLAGTACLRLPRDPGAAVWFLSVVGAVGFALISGSFYERYLLPVWSLAILGAAYARPTMRKSALAAGLLFAALTVVGVQDYFTRTRAVWTVVRELERQGIALSAVDVGMEVAGEHRFNPQARGPARVRPFLHSLSSDARVRFIAPLDPNPYSPFRLRLPFAVAYANDGDAVVAKRSYRSWVRSGTVYFLRRSPLPSE